MKVERVHALGRRGVRIVQRLGANREVCEAGAALLQSALSRVCQSLGLRPRQKLLGFGKRIVDDGGRLLINWNPKPSICEERSVDLPQQCATLGMARRQGERSQRQDHEITSACPWNRQDPEGCRPQAEEPQGS